MHHHIIAQKTTICWSWPPLQIKLKEHIVFRHKLGKHNPFISLTVEVLASYYQSADCRLDIITVETDDRRW